MTRITVALCLIATVALAAEKPPKLGVLIVVDQLAQSTFDRLFPKATAGFKRLQSEGFRFEECRYQTAPTVTSAGHATLITGTYAWKHGIVANEWFDAEVGRAIYSTEDDRYAVLNVIPAPGELPSSRACTSPKHLRAATLGDTMKAFNPAAKVVSIAGKDRAAIIPGGNAADAVVFLDPKLPIFTTSTFYAPEMYPWAAAVNQVLAKEIARRIVPKLPAGGITGESARPETERDHPPSEQEEWQPFFDQGEVDLALAAVNHYQLGKDAVPDLLSVSFSSFDKMAHENGPDSQAIETLFARVDLELGRLLDGLDKAVGKGNYVVALSADHGGGQSPELLKQRKLYAGRVDTRAALKVLEDTADAALGKDDWFEKWTTPGFVVKPGKAAKLHTIDAQLQAAARKIEGVEALVSSAELQTETPLTPVYRRGFYPGRSPEFMLATRPFWITSTRDQGAHGSAHLYDRNVPLILFGAGIKKGRAAFSEPIDVAPTLAKLLGYPAPASCEGRALIEAFK